MKGWRRTLHQSAAVWICKWYFWLLWDQQGRPVQRDARAGSGQEGKPKSRAGWVLWLNWDIVLCVCVCELSVFFLFVCLFSEEMPDWERELQEELREYDVLADSETHDDNWDKEIEEMLKEES